MKERAKKNLKFWSTNKAQTQSTITIQNISCTCTCVRRHTYTHSYSYSLRMFTVGWEMDLKSCMIPAVLQCLCVFALSLSLSPSILYRFTSLCIPQSLLPLLGLPLNPVIRRWKFVWASPAASSGATTVILKWLTACLTAAPAGDGSRIFELSSCQPTGWGSSCHNTRVLSIPRQVKQMSFPLFDWMP